MTIKNKLLYVYFNAKASFNTKFRYKASTYLTIIRKLIQLTAMYFVWQAIYANSMSINNYTVTDMYKYIVLTTVIASIYPFYVSGAFGRTVKDGSIAHDLLKPINIYWQTFTQSIGTLVYNIIFFAIPIIIYANIILGIKIYVSAYNFLVCCVFILLCYVFIFTLEMCVGSISYYTNSLWGINNFKSSVISILSGSLLPIAFYPLILIDFIKVLPFYSLYTLPINIIIGKKTPDISLNILVLIISIIISLSMCVILSKTMIKKIMVQGG